jgi:pimeloyl-ACP methyl ester carboxylesterase
LLYVCALIPNDGQSAVDVTSAFPPGPGSAEFKLDESGFLSMSNKGIHNHFAQDLTKENREILFVTQGPWAVKATTDKISKAAWKNKPAWCIIGIDDGMVPVALARAEAAMLKAKSIELKSSHVPMISRPGEVTSFIISAATELQ